MCGCLVRGFWCEVIWRVWSMLSMTVSRGSCFLWLHLWSATARCTVQSALCMVPLHGCLRKKCHAKCTVHGAAARLFEEEMPRWGCKGEVMKYHCIIFSEMLHKLRRQPVEGAHRKPWSTVAASRGKTSLHGCLRKKFLEKSSWRCKGNIIKVHYILFRKIFL